METPKVQTRKNENIITTIVPEEMYQKYLVENLYRTWKERFLDEDMDESKINLYFALLNLMTAALMSLIWTNDIFTGYDFLEIHMK